MAWRRVVPVLSLVVVASGCDAITGPSETDRLSEAVSKWEAAAFSAYEFDMIRGCYCGYPDAGHKITVRVVDDAVVQAWYTDTDQLVEETHLAQIPTIRALFILIASAITQEAHRLDVSYHPLHGAPTSISVDYVKNAIDDELGITVLEVRGPDA